MKAKLSLILLFLLLKTSITQAQTASYFEVGLMQVTPKTGKYLPINMPGFGVSIAGLEVSYYTGKLYTAGALNDSGKSTNGGYFNVGYVLRTKPLFHKLFNLTAGIGFGEYGVSDMNGFQINLNPGIQINLIKGISVAATLNAGYNFFDETAKISASFNNDDWASTDRWFAHPRVTVRINTDPGSVKGEYVSRSYHWSGGNTTHEYTTHHDGYDVKHSVTSYLPAGDYVADAIIESSNILNFYLKGGTGNMSNDRGISIVYGGGLAFRYGIFAIDVEHLQGKVGFVGEDTRKNDKNWTWQMQRNSASLGMNFFNIPFPFRGPSLIRCILGGRFGYESLQSNVSIGQTLKAVNGKNPMDKPNTTFYSPYLGVEFGTLGLNLDFFSVKEGYHSGILFSGTYLLPLNFLGGK
ncbi:MAG: hypothetical protein NTX03_10405 [Bacteroidetes bacterium]|nr:hypothetical protein [Bacteroidota bacterium]